MAGGTLQFRNILFCDYVRPERGSKIDSIVRVTAHCGVSGVTRPVAPGRPLPHVSLSRSCCSLSWVLPSVLSDLPHSPTSPGTSPTSPATSSTSRGTFPTSHPPLLRLTRHLPYLTQHLTHPAPLLPTSSYFFYLCSVSPGDRFPPPASLTVLATTAGPDLPPSPASLRLPWSCHPHLPHTFLPSSDTPFDKHPLIMHPTHEYPLPTHELLPVPPLRRLLTHVCPPPGAHQHVGGPIQPLHRLRQGEDGQRERDSGARVSRPLLHRLPDQRSRRTGRERHLPARLLTVLTDLRTHQEPGLPAWSPAHTARLLSVSRRLPPVNLASCKKKNK